MKRYARIDDAGMVIEVFETDEIERRFHSDFVATLREIPEDQGIGSVRLPGGRYLEPQPSPRHIIQGDEWVIDPRVIGEEQKQEEQNEIVEKIKTVEDVRDFEQLKEVVVNIVKFLGLIRKEEPIEPEEPGDDEDDDEDDDPRPIEPGQPLEPLEPR